MYAVGVTSLNQVFSSLSARRRYEVWFHRLGLADGSGAWWFRYLLMNPGRGGCATHPSGMPVQVWATWLPRDGKPQTFIQGFPLAELSLSTPGRSPFFFEIRDNRIDENSCRGHLHVDGHDIAWDLRYRSTFRATLSSMGWIGFSRTPHSDAVFSGKISLDGKLFDGEPLAIGLQGHNCGYRHRHCWTWAHAYFPHPDGSASSFEALVYDMPLGLRFRKAVLWHRRKQYTFRNFQESGRDAQRLQWTFTCSGRDVGNLEVVIDGNSPSAHHLPYLKTDCSGSFVVANNSLARAQLVFRQKGGPVEEMFTDNGAVLEMAGP
jgi:hypothetical protein